MSYIIYYLAMSGNRFKKKLIRLVKVFVEPSEIRSVTGLGSSVASAKIARG